MKSSMSTFDGTTLYEILQHYDRGVSPPVVTRALLAETFTPTDALLCGVPPAGGEWSTDWKLYAKNLESVGLPRETMVIIECAALAPSTEIIQQVRNVVRTRDGRERCDYYLALLGDRDAVNRLYERYHLMRGAQAAFVLGLKINAEGDRKRTFRWRRGLEAQILLYGVELLQTRAATMGRMLDALTKFEDATGGNARGDDPTARCALYVSDAIAAAEPLRRQTKRTAGIQTVETEAKAEVVDTRLKPGERVGPDDPRRFDRDMAGHLHDLHLGLIVDERTPEEIEAAKAARAAKTADVDPIMRDEPESDVRPLDRPDATFPRLMVLDSVQDIATMVADSRGDNDLMKLLSTIAGRYLDLATGPSHIREISDGLGEAWPHAKSVVDRILGDVRVSEPIRLRPTLLVGAPGSGKTSLAREIAAALSLDTTVYPCSAVSDASFGGTGAQYSTRRTSTPLDAIRRSNTANPVIVLDELEKTGSSNHNGSLLSALLPMLEMHTAKEFFEIGIERKVDLSFVNFIATANSLVDVPAPLRDRFRIVEMPDPGPEHIADLAKRIVRDLSIESGTDPAWSPPLAYDELAVIRKAWKGGSLRRLRLAVQATLDAREMVLRGRPM